MPNNSCSRRVLQKVKKDSTLQIKINLDYPAITNTTVDGLIFVSFNKIPVGWQHRCHRCIIPIRVWMSVCWSASGSLWARGRGARARRGRCVAGQTSPGSAWGRCRPGPSRFPSVWTRLMSTIVRSSPLHCVAPAWGYRTLVKSILIVFNFIQNSCLVCSI